MTGWFVLWALESSRRQGPGVNLLPAIIITGVVVVAVMVFSAWVYRNEE